METVLIQATISIASLHTSFLSPSFPFFFSYLFHLLSVHLYPSSFSNLPPLLRSPLAPSRQGNIDYLTYNCHKIDQWCQEVNLIALYYDETDQPSSPWSPFVGDHYSIKSNKKGIFLLYFICLLSKIIVSGERLPFLSGLFDYFEIFLIKAKWGSRFVNQF